MTRKTVEAYNLFGNALRERRKALKLTINQMAINNEGMRASTISAMELGRRNCKGKLLDAVSRLYGLSAAYLRALRIRDEISAANDELRAIKKKYKTVQYRKLMGSKPLDCWICGAVGSVVVKEEERNQIIFASTIRRDGSVVPASYFASECANCNSFLRGPGVSLYSAGSNWIESTCIEVPE